MGGKIRLGFIGANVRSHWASMSHFPALRASSDVELTAVCTTNPASAEEARLAFGAKLAFSDYREMVASPEIDVVAVVVRVPSHRAVTLAAIEAGKHVYVEWPLGVTTAEAEEMAARAAAKGVQTAIGLQSRVSPALLYMKELLETGYVGEVLACHLSTTRRGSFERPSSSAWRGDVANGHNPLTIHSAHVIDALRFVAGDFACIQAMVTTQVRQWYETDTRKMVEVTSPDTVLLSGQLASGAVASVHAGIVPWAPAGFRMEIYGREGTLIASGSASSQHGKMLRVQGAKRCQELQDMELPERFTHVPEDFPRGTPFNVGQMYALFAQAVRSGKAPSRLPTFDTAVEMHRLLDSICEASDRGRRVPVSVRGA